MLKKYLAIEFDYAFLNTSLTELEKFDMNSVEELGRYF